MTADGKVTLEMEVPARLHDQLEECALHGIWGNSPGEVAERLIVRGLEEWIRAGIVRGTSRRRETRTRRNPRRS